MFGAYSQSALLERDVFQRFCSLSIEMTLFDLWKYIRAIGFKIPRRNTCMQIQIHLGKMKSFSTEECICQVCWLLLLTDWFFYIFWRAVRCPWRINISISLLLHLVSDLQNVINLFLCRSWKNLFYSHCHVHTGSILSDVNLSFLPTQSFWKIYKYTHS